jgi:hypothetical protein
MIATRRTRKHGQQKPMTLDGTLAPRATRPHRRWVRSGYQGAQGYNVAVEDGNLPEMSHLGNAGPTVCLPS